MSKHDAQRIRLECGHDLWLRSPLPDVGEQLYCRLCDNYEPVGPTDVRTATVYHPDGYATSPVSRRLIEGWCLWEAGTCSFNYRIEERNFYTLVRRLDKHIMKDHVQSRFVSTLVITPVKLGKNAPPPF